MQAVRSRSGPGYVTNILLFALVCVVAIVLLNANMLKGLSHDEHMYVAAGEMIGQGMLPYRDFHYFQAPYLPFVYAVLPEFDHRFLLTARLFSTLCVWLLLGLLLFEGLRLFMNRGFALRFISLTGTVLLLAASPILLYASGLAWNHDLPVLLSVGSLLVFVRASRPAQAPGLMFASGALLAMAVGTRLSFAVLLAPFILAIPFFPGLTTWRERKNALLWYVLGFLVVLLPAGVLFALAPARALFDNIGYHTLNATWWQAQGYEQAMTLQSKVAYLREVAREPGTMALLLASLAALGTLIVDKTRSEFKYLFEAAVALGAAGALVLAALAPTPTWYQYFYAPVPFLVLGLLYALASFSWKPLFSYLRLSILALATGVALYVGVPAYSQLGALKPPSAWVTTGTHNEGVEVWATAGGGKVLTLGPLLALEAGGEVYPEFASGPFAWRCAPLLTSEERKTLGVVSPQELAGVVMNDPPDSILVGVEGALDAPLVQYARSQGYEESQLSNGRAVWLPRGLSASR